MQEPNTNVNNHVGNNAKEYVGWESAIADAEREAVQFRPRADVLRRKLKDGEPWPCDSSSETVETIATQNSDSDASYETVY
jgi:hypothetical protein